MKIKVVLCLLSLSLLAMACGNAETGGENKAENTADGKDANQATATKKDDEKKEEFTGDIKSPFDFPAKPTIAKKGDNILVPSYNWLVDATTGDADKITMIWYNQIMEEPGDETSQVKYMRETKKVPNAYIVTIPKGGNANKGDIILTWWQTGSGMQRAIVTDAKDPKAPTVRYIDLKYDNPAKDSKSGNGIGQTDYEIKPDTFYKLESIFTPGTSVMIGDEMKHGQVINAKGDKVFVKLFAGRIGVFPLADVKGVPVKPKVKAGDKVKAPYIGKFKDATVTKVDADIGRVFVKFDTPGAKEEAIAFGDIMTN